MSAPLTGKTIALAEGRQLEDLARMLAAAGAAIWRCPLISILDPDDDGPVLRWIQDLIAKKFEWVVLLTGEGFRRMRTCAERHGLQDAMLAGFANVKLLTRGPKPGQALKEVGLAPTKVAKTPTTDGVIASLREETLAGVSVGVQLYKEDNPPLTDFLAAAGAKVDTVLPYHYAPAADGDKVVELIDALEAGKMDAVVFTSSPQVDRLYEVAEEKGLVENLKNGWAKTRVAAVGPIVAQNLEDRGVTVSICPEQGFQMKNLVLHIQRAFQP